MSDTQLLIDAGNSRLKWVVVVQGTWQSPCSATYDDLSGLARQLATGMACHVASVVGPQQDDALDALLSRWRIVPVRLFADSRYADIRNAYSVPGQLGVDRWMGLIGARQRSRTATLVVSVGTALTVDAMTADGVHQGGLIVPGMRLMREALRQGTARLDVGSGVACEFPRNTADAVESGIVAALCGAIRTQHARLAECGGGVPHCIVTGGDAPRLLPHLGVSAELAPHLVLEGIDRVAKGVEPA
jgi:type III pantothenate kinase